MSVTSDEVNFLVYRYLQESGFSHSAYVFAYESLITKSSVAACDIPPGALLTFLQKGLQYVGIEEHLNEDGTERACDEEYTLLSAHVCQVGGVRGQSSANSESLKKQGLDMDVEDSTAPAAEPATGANKRPADVAIANSISKRGTGGSGSSSNSVSSGATVAAAAAANNGVPAKATETSSEYKRAAEKQDERSDVIAAAESARAATAVGASAAPAPSVEVARLPVAQPPVQDAPKPVAVEAQEPAAAGAGTAAAAARPQPQAPEPASLPPLPLPPPPLAPDGSPSVVEIQPSSAAVLDLHQSEVFMCAWNPRFDLLATGSGDATARLWEMPSGKLARDAAPLSKASSVVLFHSNAVGDKNKDVTSLEWNRSGELLATGSYDGAARIWDKDGTLMHHLGGPTSGHDGPIFSLKWNNAGNYLLTGSSDKSSIVWNTTTGAVVQQFAFHDAPTLDVDWRDNVTFASCSTDKTILIQTVGRDSPQDTLSGHTDEVNAIKWDPRGELLASCSDDSTAKIWKVGQSHCVHDLREHKKEIYTIKWSPLRTGVPTLASASFDATVKLWDAEVGKMTMTLAQDEDPVYSVAFSPSGEYLASGSFAGHLHIWSTKDGTLLRSFQGGGDIFEVAWDPRGNRIAACFSNSTVAVVDFRM